MSEAAVREVRECAACHQRDTDPHHAILVAQGDQHVVIGKHLDCCRADGCPDGSCARILAEVGELRGAELVGALTGASA